MAAPLGCKTAESSECCSDTAMVGEKAARKAERSVSRPVDEMAESMVDSWVALKETRTVGLKVDVKAVKLDMIMVAKLVVVTVVGMAAVTAASMAVKKVDRMDGL